MGDDVSCESLSDVTDRLADVLAIETALLDSFDLLGAGALLSRKREAVSALQRILAKHDGTCAIVGQELDLLRAGLNRLRAAAEANRAALERGLAAQMQLIGAIAHAVPKARAGEAPIYRPNGSKVPSRPPEAYAFLSRM